MLKQVTSPQSIGNTAALAGSGCMVLFALPFAIPGVCCLGLGWWLCWQMQETRSWTQVDAIVERVPEKLEDLDEMEYRYRWEGRWISGRGGVDGIFSDADARRRILKKARAAKQSGGQIPVWVNPRDPGQSRVLAAKTSLAPLFMGIFALSHGGVGLGMLTGSILAIREQRRYAKFRKKWPNQPWKWRADWERGVVTISNGPWRWLAAYFALVVVSLGGWVGYLIFTDAETSAWERICAGSVMAAGVGVLWLCRRLFRKHRISRDFTLHLPPRGLSQGHSYQLDLENDAGSAFRLQNPLRTWSLSCKERIGRGKASQTNEVWSGDVQVSADTGRRRTLSLEIPAGKPSSTGGNLFGVGVRWELNGTGVRGDKLGPFVLPVFDESAGEGG